jgi:glycosyltransferase involved in cell wall biosynthesis
MLTTHRFMQTWTKSVDRYIALTNFARQKFIGAGLPADKIRVKPNFVYSDPGMGEGGEEFALFVGRLHSTKGIETLLAAWDREDVPLKLRIAGDGPLRDAVKACCARRSAVKYLGYVAGDEILRLMRSAKLMIFPSQWYEGFPKTIAEALACGLPIVASKLGAMAEIVEDEVTGKLFEPGNVEDLLRQVTWIIDCPDRLRQMRRAARAAFEDRFTCDANYRRLMKIYHDALGDRQWHGASEFDLDFSDVPSNDVVAVAGADR